MIKNKTIKTTFFLLIFLWVSFARNQCYSQSTTWQKGNEDEVVNARFITSFYKNNDQTKLIAGLHIKIKQGWKIYGNDDSGGIGLIPNFDFSKSNNYKNHNIIWPESKQGEEKIGDQVFKYSYYNDEVIIPIEIEIDDQNKNTILNLNVNYGACKEVCIPINQNFSIDVKDNVDDEILTKIQKFYPKAIIDGEIKNKNNTKNKILSILLFAFIGGVILNIMPCVLPVLSIKLISIINHTNLPISKIRFAFLYTICGIISCFVFIGFVTHFIKITGSSLGWGFHFQNEYFLFFLIFILMIFSANLLGFFEINIGQKISSEIDNSISSYYAKNKLFIANFLSGILAVLLATPCSAPFLGTAISFCLTRELTEILLIFVVIGVGFSLPYILLIIMPSLVKFLPKSGKWMIFVKKLMAIFLILTVVWIVYILSQTLNIFYIVICLFFLTLSSFLIFKKVNNFFVKLLLLLLTIVVIMFAIKHIPQIDKIENSKQTESISWIEFNESDIEKYVNEGRIVFVDVTASWCITCKFNKFHTLSNLEVINLFKNKNIIAMRSDITKPNENVMNFIKKHNRFAIPFNIIYGPDAKDGLLTSELLNKNELFLLVKKAKNNDIKN